MNNEISLSIFNYQENQVRTQTIDGEPWFVAKDVADILGVVWNGTTTIKHVPSEWRGVLPGNTPSSRQEMVVLSEQGLYFFLGRSEKTAALPFQKWIAGEVLPSVRKTGSYSVAARSTADQFNEVFQGAILQVTGQLGAVAGKIVEHEAAIRSLQTFQENVDPHQLAIEAAAIEEKRKRQLGELRGQLGKIVKLIIARAKSLPDEDTIAKTWNHPAKVWPPIHRSVGLHRLEDYSNPDQFDRAITFAGNTLRQLGQEPSTQLRLVG